MTQRDTPQSPVIPIRGIAVELRHYHPSLPVMEIVAHLELMPPAPVWGLADSFVALALQAWQPHLPKQDDGENSYTLSFTWQWEDNRATDWEIPLVNDDDEGAEIFDWQPGRLARELREAYLHAIAYAEGELPEIDYPCPDPEEAREFILTHEIGG
jgi:hypothetical protein